MDENAVQFLESIQQLYVIRENVKIIRMENRFI